MPVFEFRGVDNLVYAEVVEDTKERFVTGPVKELSPVAEIGRKTAGTVETHYYDNKPLIVITAAGSDEIRLIITPPDLFTYAEITSQKFALTSGTLFECKPRDKYFAIGYRTKGTDGFYRYVWRLKGKFAIPDETSQTESDLINTNNTELSWTGITTVHDFPEFEKDGPKSLICDERYDAIEFDQFFSSVQTPETIESLAIAEFITSDDQIFTDANDNQVYVRGI